ncbi:hypothetical protein Fcan01_03695 [Folsomia candida]|uniref:Uncharacterized protein n=1 Tax=Folsomia candida TaxID=158441 RepID=A0A226F6F9_FOLCA|nr:hypothetical protein Fcan01_03695 [Folsomia candida]
MARSLPKPHIVYLTRHGESLGNVQKCFLDSREDDLTKTGELQDHQWDTPMPNSLPNIHENHVEQHHYGDHLYGGDTSTSRRSRANKCQNDLMLKHYHTTASSYFLSLRLEFLNDHTCSACFGWGVIRSDCSLKFGYADGVMLFMKEF